jgi:hypothetical protein
MFDAKLAGKIIKKKRGGGEGFKDPNYKDN